MVLLAACATAKPKRELPRSSIPLTGPRVIAIQGDAERWPLAGLLEERGIKVPTGREALDVKWVVSISSCEDQTKWAAGMVRPLQLARPGALPLLMVSRPSTECELLLRELADAIARSWEDAR